MFVARVEPSAPQILRNRLDSISRFTVQGSVPCIEVPDQPVSQGWAHQTLLDEDGVIAKSIEYFPESIGQPGTLADTFPLMPERFSGDRRLPQLVQRHGLLQVRRHLLHEELS